MKINLKLINLHNLILFLLLISTFTGAAIYLYIPQLQFFRVILIVSALYLFINLINKKKLVFDNLSKLLFLWFTLYFILTLIATIMSNILLGYNTKINDIVNFFILYFLVIILLVYINLNSELFVTVLYNSLKFALLLMSIIAFIEFFTHWHFSNAVFFKHAPHYIQYQASTFFGNPNDFMAVYTMALILLLGIYKINKYTITIDFYIFYIIGIFFSFINNSRLTMLVLFFNFFIFFFNKRNLIKILFIFIFGAILFINFITKFEYFNYLIKGLTLQGNSVSIRENLYEFGLYSIEENYGLGFGINASSQYYSSLNNYFLKGIINPHNYLLEILINSGVFAFFTYILVNLLLVWFFFKKGFYMLIYMISIYPIILLSSSSSLFLWFHYVYLVSIIALYKYKKEYNEKSSKHSI